MAPKASYGVFLSQLNRYLEGKYGKDNGSSRDTLSSSELKRELAPDDFAREIIKYLIGIIDECVSEACELFISQHPVEFIKALSEFLYEFRLDQNSNKQNTVIKRPFFLLLIEDLRNRPESGLLNTQQLHWLANATSRFSEEGEDKLDFVPRMDAEKIGDFAESLCSRVLVEHFRKQETQASDHSYLFALGSFINHSKYENSFESLSLANLFSIFEDLRAAEKNQAKARSSIGELELLCARAISDQIEKRILFQLAQTRATSIDVQIILGIKALYREVGAKPESLGLIILQKLSELDPDEGLDSFWWEPLTLRDLLQVIKQSASLGNALISSANQGTWFTRTIDRHVSDSDSLQDLAIGLEANGIFGIPTSRDLMRIWMSVSPRSPVLHEIEKSLVEDPVNRMKLIGEKHLAEATAAHQVEIETLRSDITVLRTSISTFESTMQREKDSLGDTKASLETGISRKYGDSIARIIRRMEREAGKNSFQDIIAKESSGLSRLGITLLISGENQMYDPIKHESIGLNLDAGANVTIIETGVLLLLGKDTITLLKAVVRPA